MVRTAAAITRKETHAMSSESNASASPSTTSMSSTSSSQVWGRYTVCDVIEDMSACLRDVDANGERATQTGTAGAEVVEREDLIYESSCSKGWASS